MIRLWNVEASGQPLKRQFTPEGPTHPKPQPVRQQTNGHGRLIYRRPSLAENGPRPARSADRRSTASARSIKSNYLEHLCSERTKGIGSRDDVVGKNLGLTKTTNTVSQVQGADRTSY